MIDHYVIQANINRRQKSSSRLNDMAINKNSTGYTFTFSIVMVVIIGASLAYTSLSLKPLQKANAADKQMVDILGAIQVSSSRATAKDDFQKVRNREFLSITTETSCKL